MKKFLAMTVTTALLLSGCQGKTTENTDTGTWKDGSYHGVSSNDDWGGRVEADITIENGMIVAAELHNIDKDNNEKGEDYGKDTGNPGLIKIAQDAIKNAQDYPKQLVSTNDIEQVEVISGATNSYDLFKEAVNNALSQAKE